MISIPYANQETKENKVGFGEAVFLGDLSWFRGDSFSSFSIRLKTPLSVKF